MRYIEYTNFRGDSIFKNKKLLIIEIIVISCLIFSGIYCYFFIINLIQLVFPKQETGPIYEIPIFVITKDEQNEKIRYYKIDRQNNYIKTKPFVPDPITTYFIYGCTETYLDSEKGKFLNRLDEQYCEIERENQKVNMTKDFKNIIKAVADLEHNIWDKKILKYHGDYYIVIALNVNFSSPYDLYKYDKETKKLIRICEFNDEDIIGIKIKE